MRGAYVDDDGGGDSESETENDTLRSDTIGSERSSSNLDLVRRGGNGHDATLAGRRSPAVYRASSASPSRLEIPKQEPRDAVAWMDLPEKAQLIVITLARLSEPLTQSSIQVSSSCAFPGGAVDLYAQENPGNFRCIDACFVATSARLSAHQAYSGTLRSPTCSTS